ncbi:MAG: two-component sensor histidine kinase, partial [Planctomycetota bacterium]
AIVHRIADAHDGRVTVRNGADGGAVVELVLPAARETRITHEPTRAGARAHGGEA